MSNIDWDFITEQEGGRILKGYLPDRKSKSGVTIATGFDLGQRSESDLQGLPASLIAKLKPFLGIKGAKADQMAGDLVITEDEGRQIDEFSKGEATDRLARKWKAATGQDFSDLPKSKATTLASVAFQYGDLESRTPNFWKQTTSGDWDAATDNLRNFGDRYGSRRTREANYLMEGRLSETLARTAPPDAPSRQLSDEELIARVKEQTGTPDIITEPSKKKLGEPDPIPQIRQTITEPVTLPDLSDDLPIIDKRQLDPPPAAPNTKPKSYYQLPKQADIESSYTSLYGEPNTVYGDRIPSQLGNQDQYDYDIFDRNVDVLGAAFRQYNIFSALGRAIQSSYADFQPEEGYSAYNDKALAKKIGGSDMLYMFRHNNSHAESMQQLENMQEDYEDMKILNAHESTAAEFTAALASPTTLLPLAPMRVLKMASPVKRFVGGTAFTAAAVMPEQMIIESQNEYRDASHSALMLSALSLVGGALTAKFGKNIAATTPPRSGGDDGIYRAAGAGVSPERYRQSMYATMEQEALEETGVGLERVGWNPVLRMAKSNNPFVRSLAPMMVNMGGLMQKKVRASGEKMADSVEAKFTGMYMGSLLDSIRDANLAYLKYRGVAANKAKTDIGTSIELVKLAAKDKLGQTVDYLSETQFRIRVGKAMRNGDVDTIADEATEAVNAAAQSYRRTFNLIKEQAESVRLFEAQLVDDLGKARAAGDTVAVSRIEEALRKLQEQGVTPNNAKSYLPRIYRVDMIMKHQREFLAIIADHGRRELGLRGAKAEAYAQEVMDTVTRNRPFYDADEVIDSLDFVKNASGVQARTLDIDDMRIEKFLENDAEVLLRHHVKTMGMDIELTRAFGSVTMKGTIDEVVTEYKRLIDEAPSSFGEAPKKAPKFDNTFANRNVFDEHFETGVEAEVTMFRGSGGGGKVAFAESSFGDGVYLARTKKTAKKFGKNVEELSVKLRNPIVFKSDQDLMDYYKTIEHPFPPQKLQEVKDELFKALDELNEAIANKRPVAEVREISDRIFIDKGMARSLNTSYTLMRRDMMNKIAESVRSQGYDSAVFSFKEMDFYQATKGEITPSKMRREYNSHRRYHEGSEGMALSLSHDQIVLFKDIDQYKIVDDVVDKPKFTKADLKKQMEADIRDIRGLRDRLRGTYGASKDPHAMSSRFIRTMKSFNVFTSMGSAMISSVPDVARTVMVEGLTNTYEKGFRHLFSKQAEYVKAMKRRELRMAGVAADAVLGLRAHAFSDVGDLFGSRYGFERGLNKATGMFFMMNGLNYWNQALKEFAGNVTMLRMTDSLMRNWDSLKAADREKFLKNGIDRQDHYRMAEQIRQHGKRVNGEWMPNTDSWTDPTLRLRFRMALNQNVERIIITPGAGDRALWTSTEMGSFLTQFKSYGQGAMVRMLTSGLQEKDGAFWQGAFLLVGLAALVNEIKKAQYGIEGEESFDEKLINAVDRSGILGWSMDVNNALEKMSDYKLGMRPFLTDQPQFALPETAKAGAVFGPGISNIMNATKVMGDVVTFNADQSTADTARFLTPTGNIPYLDPLWDGLYGQ